MIAERQERILTDEDGFFSAEISLPTGLEENEITITATDGSGIQASDNMEMN